MDVVFWHVDRCRILACVEVVCTIIITVIYPCNYAMINLLSTDALDGCPEPWTEPWTKSYASATPRARGSLWCLLGEDAMHPSDVFLFGKACHASIRRVSLWESLLRCCVTNDTTQELRGTLECFGANRHRSTSAKAAPALHLPGTCIARRTSHEPDPRIHLHPRPRHGAFLLRPMEQPPAP